MTVVQHHIRRAEVASLHIERNKISPRKTEVRQLKIREIVKLIFEVVIRSLSEEKNRSTLGRREAEVD